MARMRTHTAAAAAAILLLGCFSLASCSTGGSTASVDGTFLRVVAAENFYGDIAQQIGGDRVHVTSILTDPDADPHLFEPGTETGLAVAQADLVVMNGLGYDAFMDRLLAASPNDEREVVDAHQVIGISGTDANPHLWYATVELPKVASAVGHALETLDPAHAGTFRANERRFVASLRPIERAIGSIRSAYRGVAVASTEPVAGYLLAAAGLQESAPESFTRAIEAGSEPSPQVTAAMNDELIQHRVAVLIYNTQTVDRITEQLQTTAKEAGIPVVGVSETEPPGTSFQRWQLSQVQALQVALGA
jgi:zinc/manganese transport system substrate-binding protein